MDWQELTNLTRGQPFVVERVRLVSKNIALEGSFELSQLAQLSLDDQVFVTAFVRCHGSIKEMERIFGVSYPTIKSRLNRIGASLDFIDTNPEPPQPDTGAEVLERLSRGEISADEAARLLDAPEHTDMRGREPSSQTHEPNQRPVTHLRVMVDVPESFDGDGPGKVNVRVPFQLLRAGVQLASLIPPKALSQVNEELRKSGVSVNLAQLKPQHIEELIEALNDMTVEVDQPDAKLRVFCE